MRTLLFFSLILAGCTPQGSLTGRREIIEMKEQLVFAQKKLKKQKVYVAQLEEEIARHEIARIQKEIDEIKQQKNMEGNLSNEQWLDLFHQQREVLAQIILDHSACRSEAQSVLDQILMLITNLSEDSVE